MSILPGGNDASVMLAAQILLYAASRAEIVHFSMDVELGIKEQINHDGREACALTIQ